MIAQAFIATLALMIALAFLLLQECTFLIPYRQLLYERYSTTLLMWTSLLFVNIFAALYAAGRTLFLKDTGHKLAHLEKQIRTGHSLAEDLTHRLRE